MSTAAAAALENSGGANNGAAAAAAAGAGGGANGAAPTHFFDDWKAPEQKDVLDWAKNKNYPDTFTLARTARDLEREAATLRQGKGYPVDKPGADGKPVRDEAAWQAWKTLTGVPETPDKYEIPLPDANPYPQFKTFMAEELHKIGVPGAMAPALARGYEAAVARMEAEIQKAENTASEAAMAQLKDSWGANFQERTALAGRGKTWLASEVGGLNDIQMRTLESVLGTSKFMTAMWKIGAANGESGFAGGDHKPGGNAFQGGASEAQARIDQMTAARAAGTVNEAQWREYSKAGGEMEQLINRIASGNAQA